ncbi:TfoX/Sxy family DNA transformation protein [Amphritea sp. HPY]|uniref:TfoX/Sxy family DNA transformation protein n=1 Tax=Amphritea sp. HPY TaxID=3421652 RepID=UPI003D7CA0CA
MNKSTSSDLAALRGLGKVSAGWLIEAGISSAEELVEVGAVRAYLRVHSLPGINSGVKPGMNLLYALVGAIENRPWQEVARIEKGRLLSELESYREMDRLFDGSGS